MVFGLLCGRFWLPLTDTSAVFPEERDLFVPGEVIGKRYQIGRYLARGGMGLVYEATDLESGQKVALKALKPKVADDHVSTLRFYREIELALRIDHPNVCALLDSGSHETPRTKVEYLVMELLRGETLSELLARKKVLPRESVRTIVIQIANGLAAAHSVGVLHRDLKSGNIILHEGREGMRAVITDFGLARSVRQDSGPPSARLTAIGQLMGTPAYFAPELLESKDLTEASDVYSFGVLIFEMLTGTLPFTGSTPLMTALKRLREAPPDPRTLVPDLEPVWVEILKKCLERKLEKRYSSPRDILATLGAEVSLAVPTTSPGKVMTSLTEHSEWIEPEPGDPELAEREGPSAPWWIWVLSGCLMLITVLLLLLGE